MYSTLFVHYSISLYNTWNESNDSCHLSKLSCAFESDVEDEELTPELPLPFPVSPETQFAVELLEEIRMAPVTPNLLLSAISPNPPDGTCQLLLCESAATVLEAEAALLFSPTLYEFTCDCARGREAVGVNCALGSVLLDRWEDDASDVKGL